MNEHTPGPWEVSGHHHGESNAYFITNVGVSEYEVEANACLIAAAPDLLAAGKAMLEALANCPGEFNYPVLIETELRTAIAKAENGSE